MSHTKLAMFIVCVCVCVWSHVALHVRYLFQTSVCVQWGH